MATKFRMGEITGGEARALAARGPVILLPLGSHEDHGGENDRSCRIGTAVEPAHL